MGGDRSWIDSNTLTSRWDAMENYLGYLYNEAPEFFTELAKVLSPVHDDVVLTTEGIVDFFIPNGLHDPADYEQAVLAFKWEVPENYFEDYSWNLEWNTVPAQMLNLLRHMSTLPEFQTY